MLVIFKDKSKGHRCVELRNKGLQICIEKGHTVCMYKAKALVMFMELSMYLID